MSGAGLPQSSPRRVARTRGTVGAHAAEVEDGPVAALGGTKAANAIPKHARPREGGRANPGVDELRAAITAASRGTEGRHWQRVTGDKSKGQRRRN